MVPILYNWGRKSHWRRKREESQNIFCKSINL